MSSRAAVVISLVLVVGLGCLETAAAASGFRFVGSGGVTSDGIRYAAVPKQGEPVLIFDTTRPSSFRLPPPLPPSAAKCDFTAIGAGQAVWTCSSPATGSSSFDRRPVPILTDLATRSSRGVAGAQNLFRCPQVACAPFGHTYSGIGRAWIRVDTYSFFGTYYLSRTTGEVRRGGDGPRTQPDLDRPALVRRICRPVRRPALPGLDGGPSHVQVDIEGRSVLLPASGIGPQSRPLQLFRCGRRRPRVLSRCRPTPCESSGLSAGVVTWAQGNRVWSYRLRTRRRKLVGSLPVGSFPPGAPLLGVARTRTRVFAVALQRQAVYVARLPR